MLTAICCMTMQPEHFEFWIRHHIETVGFDYIFLRQENTILTIPEIYQDRVFVCQHESITDSHINSIPRQQIRQISFVNYCLQKICPSMNIDYLLHIDDDELMVLEKNISSIQQLLESFDQENITNLRFQNYEAVLRFTPQHSHFFFQTHWFKNGSLEECRSYRNGKSITNVSKQQRCNGCHTFTGEWKKVNEDQAIILHYDSITFEKWKKKFHHLKIMTGQDHSFLFPFYQQCIDLFLQNPSHDILYSFWLENISKADNPIDVTRNYRFDFFQ